MILISQFLQFTKIQTYADTYYMVLKRIVYQRTSNVHFLKCNGIWKSYFINEHYCQSITINVYTKQKLLSSRPLHHCVDSRKNKVQTRE